MYTDASQRMLAMATYGEVAALLFHTPTKYGSDRFRQIFIDHWEHWWDYRRIFSPTGSQICRMLPFSLLVVDHKPHQPLPSMYKILDMHIIREDS